ncbi:MAG: DUF362 domain-containing protein [bacterium]
MKSKVAIVKGNDRRKNIYNALELIKEDILSKINDKNVLIKPNCLQSRASLSCTHIDALRGILDFLSQNTPKSVTISETCMDSKRFESFERLGYTKLSDEYNVSLQNPHDENNWILASLINKSYEEIKVKISRSMMESDCRISAAVAKTHDTVTITASWKNMMGALALEDKVKMHGVNSHRDRILISEVEILPQNLIRLAKIIPPHIGVIDGFIGMEGNGPVSGSEKYLGIAIASIDFVAADAVCAKSMGFDPMDISYLYYGHQLGLGTADLKEINIIGEPIELIESSFVPHVNYMTQMRWKEFIPSL